MTERTPTATSSLTRLLAAASFGALISYAAAPSIIEAANTYRGEKNADEYTQVARDQYEAARVLGQQAKSLEETGKTLRHDVVRDMSKESYFHYAGARMSCDLSTQGGEIVKQLQAHNNGGAASETSPSKAIAACFRSHAAKLSSESMWGYDIAARMNKDARNLQTIGAVGGAMGGILFSMAGLARRSRKTAAQP